jgi:hypothetical protein
MDAAMHKKWVGKTFRDPETNEIFKVNHIDRTKSGEYFAHVEFHGTMESTDSLGDARYGLSYLQPLTELESFVRVGQKTIWADVPETNESLSLGGSLLPHADNPNYMYGDLWKAQTPITGTAVATNWKTYTFSSDNLSTTGQVNITNDHQAALDLFNKRKA